MKARSSYDYIKSVIFASAGSPLDDIPKVTLDEKDPFARLLMISRKVRKPSKEWTCGLSVDLVLSMYWLPPIIVEAISGQ